MISPGIYTSEYIVRTNGGMFDASIGLPLAKGFNPGSVINYIYLLSDGGNYIIVSETGEKIITQ